MIIKPAKPDVNVPYPMSQRTLAPEGAEVPDGDLYWIRRLRAGEVVRVEHAPDPTAPVAPLTTR
jgi:hypothetical protein